MNRLYPLEVDFYAEQIYMSTYLKTISDKEINISKLYKDVADEYTLPVFEFKRLYSNIENEMIPQNI